jgi:hypothetical protein
MLINLVQLVQQLPSQTTIDNEKLQQFMGKVLSDLGGAASAVLVYIGDKLGLYKAMSDFGKPITSQELANLTGTSERYIREWLANQAAGGYLTYDPSSQRYTLPFEHAQALVRWHCIFFKILCQDLVCFHK